MGSSHSTHTRQSAYNPLDRINIPVTGPSQRHRANLRSANSLHIKSEQLAGAPEMVMLAVIVTDNGPSIFAKAYNGYQLRYEFISGALKIWCTAETGPYDISNAPSVIYYTYSPVIHAIHIIEE